MVLSVLDYSKGKVYIYNDISCDESNVEDELKYMGFRLDSIAYMLSNKLCLSVK